MRAAAKVVFLGVLLGGGVASAADPMPHRTPEDYVKAIDALKATVPPASSPNVCAEGLALNHSGSCEPLPETEQASLVTFPDAERSSSSSTAYHASPGVNPVAHKVKYTPPPGSTLSDLMITFQKGSAVIDDAGRVEARSFALGLMRPSEMDMHFELAGHTDASGSASRNQALSEARAMAVRDFLVAQGVDAGRLEAKGYGKAELLRPDAPFDKANRRVEAKLLH